MRFDLVTIFPEFFAGPLDHGIVRRAKEAGSQRFMCKICASSPRTVTAPWTTGRSGGGEGMVLKPEPLF